MAARLAAFTCIHHANVCRDQLASTKLEYLQYPDQSALKAMPIEYPDRAPFERVVNGSIKLLSDALEKHQSIDGEVYEQILKANANRLAVFKVGEDYEPTAHQAARHAAYAVLHCIESRTESGMGPVEFLDAVLKSLPSIDYGNLESEIHVEYAGAVANLPSTAVAGNPVETLTVKQLAESKRCDESTVRRWCERMKFQKDASGWRIPADEASKWHPRDKAAKATPPTRTKVQRWECSDCNDAVDAAKKPKKCTKCNREVRFDLIPAK
jgi:hypothetical protein